jgi:hypothetical protein
MRVGIWGIASFIFLALAPAAYAGQRYAAPAGTGSECTQVKPCELKEAVVGAKAGEEVIVTSGTYEAKEEIFTPPFTNVQIHGDLSGPMPKINAAFSGPLFLLNQPGDSLSYLEIEDNANGAVGALCFGGKLERLRVRVVGLGGTGAQAFTDCSVRNSLFIVEGGSGATALRGGAGNTGATSASVKNVTAIAAGSASTGVSAAYEEPASGSFTLNLENVIAQGGEQDLKPINKPNGPGNISATHSNFDTSKAEGEGGATVIDGGGNQTALPLFVNAELGNYHETAGSPTIDAGVAGELGPLDLDGSPRVLGAAPDIGAYETLTPPKAIPVVPELQSLSVAPNAFRAAKSGDAVASATKKAKGPVGTTVTFSLSGGGAVTVKFSVEQLITGRKAGKRCVKQTAANKGKAKCTFAKKLNGGFSDQGSTGQNHFKFSGRLGSRALKPGRYKLVGSAGGVDKSAAFKITG